MGNIVISEFITLDGVIEDPGGAEGSPRGGWTSIGDGGGESMQFKFAELMASDAQLLGRVTYEGFARAWPTMEGTGEFGEKDERDAQVRRVLDARRGRLEQHDDPER
jgi:dihydrofolate reductase